MRSHNAHHFVPAFILREWQTLPDDKLSAFWWINDALVHKRYKAKNVAKEVGLYALRNKVGIADNVVERDFFAREIDDPASVVHRKILDHGVASLSATEWHVWDRFMVAQMLRGPRMVAHLRRRGAEIFGRSMLADENADDDEAPDSSTFTLSDWIKQNPDSLNSDNLSMAGLPSIVNSDLLYDNMRRAGSVTVELPSTAPFNFLIGDHALCYVGAMEAKFVIMLPIAPHVVFVKCDSRETAENIRKLTARQLASDANFTTVTGAERYVYATDASQFDFIEQNLDRPA
jgi:hypothetical protein